MAYRDDLHALAARHDALAAEVAQKTRELEESRRLLEQAWERRRLPVLDQIQVMLLHLHAVLPGSAFGKALHYLHGQWPKLVRYVENGSWPISNNACENAIRPFVIGRRNFLFCDTVAGANASANLYSLIETCKANGVDAYRYLIALLTALPLATTVEDYETLLPWTLNAAE